MKLTTFFNTLALLAAAILLLTTEVVMALSSQETDLAYHARIPEGYNLSPLRITGDINGIAINHTGTVQEVFTQLEVEYPGSHVSTAGQSDEALDKRYMTDVACVPVPGQNWARASIYEIDDGIRYLRKKNLTCWVNGHSCSRVSCSYDDAIFLCNNNPQTIGPDCEIIADFAQTLRNMCTDIDEFNTRTVGGQAWDIGNWNVNVYRNNC